MSVEDKPVEALDAMFKARQISTVAIVDDAYNKCPSLADFQQYELVILSTALSTAEGKLELAVASLPNFTAGTELNDEQLAALYELVPTVPEVGALFREYTDAQLGRRAQLRDLEELLRKLECDIVTLSPIEPLDSLRLPQVIFLDYLLDPRGADYSLTLAQSIGERIAEAYSGIAKPYVVLMSTSHPIPQESKSHFRDTAGLLGGRFHFIRKQELVLGPLLLLKLAILVQSMEEGTRIQEFVEAFEGELRDATNRFEKKIRGLTVEDYGYMQQLSLQGEGRPLGDYLLWIFGTYFAHLLFRSVPDHRRRLDRLRFEHVPESGLLPSLEFIDLYRNVVAEEVDELGNHPRAPESTTDGLPDIHFGDLFVNSNKDAFLNIAAECDLRFAPEAGSVREGDASISVLLVPGTFEEMGNSLATEGHETAFVQLDSKTYRIAWRVKSTVSVSLGEVRNMLASKGFRRRARLRHPFSTDVQTAFMTNVGRVGIPIAPPILRPADVRVYMADAAGAVQERSLGRGSAIMYRDREENECIHLKLDAIAEVLNASVETLSILDAVIEREKDPIKLKRVTSLHERLTAFIAKLDNQLALTSPVAVKAGGSYTFPGSLVEIIRDRSKLEARLKNVPIILLIEENSDAVTAETREVQPPSDEDRPLDSNPTSTGGTAGLL